MLKRYRFRDYDIKLVVLLIAVTIFGILAIGSAQETVQNKQIGGFIAGLFLMVLISFFDYNFFLQFYWLMYLLNFVLLTLVPIFGVERNAAKRWINIAGIQFQPSETAKILLILFFAQYIIKHKESINSFKTLVSLVILMLPPIYLIKNQPDLSTTIMLLFIFCVLLFIGGLSYKIIFSAFAIVIPVFVILISIAMQPDQKILTEYQQKRILAWINPLEYANDVAYQQENSKTAIASGQLYGRGYKNEDPTSVKNGNYLSESQTDFIFAIIGEEFGFIGCSIIIILLLLITLECILIGRRASDLSGTLICAGMAALVGGQSFINIGVATGVLPNTGLPLPFVSYGLTSLVSLYIGMGFVLNVGLQRTRKYS